MIAPSANMKPKNRMKRRMPAFAGWATGHSARPLMGLCYQALLHPKLWRKQGLRARIEVILPCMGAVSKPIANKNPGQAAGAVSWRASNNQRLKR
jgi:hypothetical protein